MSHWICVVSLLCCVGVGISALSGKGFYCRDPDTGKLHPGNSTWPSTTFCGNYTCKLRKKIVLDPKAPIREFNVMNTISDTAEPKSSEVDEMRNEDTRKDHLSILTTLNPSYFSVPPIKPATIISDVSELSQKEDNIENQKLFMSIEEDDRLLTELEIKTISKILHNVKKSDLEAIVDIYNLAQDIYKEMDKITTDNIVEETSKAVKTLPKASGDKRYWYEPLHRLKPRIDMEFQGANTYPTTVERSTIEPKTYFQGPLAKTDFGSLPYYYPISNFHRHSSYMHPSITAQGYPPKSDKPCPMKTPAPIPYQPPTQSYYPFNHQPQSYGGVMKKPFAVDTQKDLKPSILLPYPFSYVQQYNMSAYPLSLEYDPWSHFDVIKNTDKYQQYFNAYLPQAKVSSNAINTKAKTKSNPISKNDDDDTKVFGEKSLFDNLFEHAKLYEHKSKSKPAWQTDPLSPNVIKEIKANFEENAHKLLQPLSLRKKVKLEKVGKLIKLDDRIREKRNASFEVNSTEKTDESFETYLEKTTCRSEEEPGFYKMGNQSAPYPSCCPQIIDSQR